jgi:hypothetical protein
MFCGHCGLPVADGDHTVCVARLDLEPPRFCASCARRMKVQVTPTGWSAACVAHGVLSG